MSRIFFTLYDRHVHRRKGKANEDGKAVAADDIKNNKNIYIHLVNLKQNDDEENW
jgi:hypothetical protein